MPAPKLHVFVETGEVRFTKDRECFLYPCHGGEVHYSPYPGLGPYQILRTIPDFLDGAVERLQDKLEAWYGGTPPTASEIAAAIVGPAPEEEIPEWAKEAAQEWANSPARSNQDYVPALARIIAAAERRAKEKA